MHLRNETQKQTHQRSLQLEKVVLLLLESLQRALHASRLGRHRDQLYGIVVVVAAAASAAARRTVAMMLTALRLLVVLLRLLMVVMLLLVRR